MKTIDEAAKDRSESEWCVQSNQKWHTDELKDICIQDFKKGVEFAQRWISVEEEMPENVDGLLLSDSEIKLLKGRKLGMAKTKEVIIRFKDGSFETSRRYQCKGDNYFWWGSIENFDGGSERQITHWRSIELR